MALNGRADPDTHAPSPTDSESSISRGGFRIATRKMPILKADPIEEMNVKLGITVPEMIFGDNYVRIVHEASKWEVVFNAFDALDRVDKTGEKMLQVAHSEEWQSTRYIANSQGPRILTNPGRRDTKGLTTW
jgi:TIP41-like family